MCIELILVSERYHALLSIGIRWKDPFDERDRTLILHSIEDGQDLGKCGERISDAEEGKGLLELSLLAFMG
jgi:hypothetical protein